MLSLSQITADQRLQHREVDEAYIQGMAEVLEEGGDMPPVKVMLDSDGRYWLWDGFQRLAAYKLAKRKEIPATIYKADFRAAWKASLGANDTNGRNRSTAEIDAILDKCFADEEISKMSDASVAGLAGVSKHCIKRYREATASAEKAAAKFPVVNAKLPGRKWTSDMKVKQAARRAFGVLVEALENMKCFDNVKAELAKINEVAGLL